MAAALNLSYIETGIAATMQELEDLRMVHAIASGGLNGSETELTLRQVSEYFRLEASKAEMLRERLAQLDILDSTYEFAEGNSIDETLNLSALGMRVFGAYRDWASSESDIRGKRIISAARAILLWRYDSDAKRKVVGDILATPGGYLYGDHFREKEELRVAFSRLLSKGLLSASGSVEDKSFNLQITDNGRDCVIDFDADTVAYERSVRGDSVSNTFNIKNVGNLVAGDNHGTMNSWTNVQDSVDAANLLAAAVRLAAINGEFRDDASSRLAEECHDEFRQAATTAKTSATRKALVEKFKELAGKSAGAAGVWMMSAAAEGLLTAFAQG